MSDLVTVRELRQNLSVYLRRIEAGETLTVTRRGERVAVLAPPPGRRSAIDWLILNRGSTRPVGDLLELGAPPAPEPGEKSIGEALKEQREERSRPA